MADTKTEREIVDACNALARRFYAMQGCEVPVGYKFHEAHHPAELSCWYLAVEAYNHIEGTDVEDCLATLGE